MIYGADHTPAPPAEMVRRLQQIHPDLNLAFNDPGEHGGSHWTITWRWPTDDRRWQRVSSGEVPEREAFDIISRLPLDCSVDEAYGYVVNTFRANMSREDMAQLLERAHKYNEGVQKAAEDEAMADAYNLAEVRGAAIVGEVTGNRVIKVGPGSTQSMKRGRGRPPGSKNKPKTKR